MENRKARLELPADPVYEGPAVDFAVSFAERLHCGSKEAKRLRGALSLALKAVMLNNSGGKSDEPVTLELEGRSGKLVVEIVNRGVPLLLGGGRSALNASYFSQFHEASTLADKLSLGNFGRKGQVLTLEIGLGAQAVAMSLPTPEAPPGIPEGEKISVRLLEPGEEGSLSRLFYLVYGYHYINELVYYPDKLGSMLKTGELISIVAARENGRLVGHVGLLRKNASPPVYEAAMGVVDPAVKARGLFGKLFQSTMEQVKSTRMQYCFFDFVTNHGHSQKHINKYGVCELALYAGCQSSDTQASLTKLGLGADPKGMDRYSLLTGIIPQTPHPFGKSIALPENLRASLGFLLKPLGLEWTPVPRFELYPEEGSYSSSTQGSQKAVIFDLETPGRGAVEDIVAQWTELRRNGFQYAAVDLPAQKPGLATLYEQLSSNGFFLGGFVPYRFSDRLGLRFQSLGPTTVAFDQIQVVSPAAKKLLETVRKEYEAYGKI